MNQSKVREIVRGIVEERFSMTFYVPKSANIEKSMLAELYINPTPAEIQSIFMKLKNVSSGVNFAVDMNGNLYAWSGVVPHDILFKELRAILPIKGNYQKNPVKLFTYASVDYAWINKWKPSNRLMISAINNLTTLDPKLFGVILAGGLPATYKTNSLWNKFGMDFLWLKDTGYNSELLLTSGIR